MEKPKFVGVYVDCCLTWRPHIQYIQGKIARSLGILSKARKFFNGDTLLTLYYSFLHPYLSYCIEIWGNTFTTYLDPLKKLQNRAVRMITGIARRKSVSSYYKELKILPLNKLYMYIIQLFMYKWQHVKLPTMFDSFFKKNYEISRRDTRQSCLLHIPDGFLKIQRRNIKFNCVRLHNYLYVRLCFKCSIQTYKYKLK